MDEFILRAGTPDDDNRDYLPERIKGSDIVVNENGNNSQPYPDRLLEYHAPLTDDDYVDEWYEYVPSGYDPAVKTPLVLSMHGGLMTGWGQAIYTSWTIMAEKHNFIVAFPNASSKRVWSVEWGKWRFDGSEGTHINENPPEELIQGPKNIEDNRDAKMALALIAKMQEKYNIDEERIFMQGMSMGNMMTAMFSRYYGNILAGAAGSGCSTFGNLLFEEDGTIKNRGGHLPVWQSRPENNDIPPVKEDSLYINKYNRYYWMKLNACNTLPQISIIGEDNMAFFEGEKADLVYLDIKNRDHGQTLDDAALIWNYFFSGLRRKADGTIVREKSNIQRKGDAFAISVADGCHYAWRNNTIVPLSTPAMYWQKLKYHGLNGGQIVRGEYLMAPVSFLAESFGAEYQPSEDTLTAKVVLKDGRTLQFARGSIGCVIDNTLRSMYCETLHRNGELLVSVEWFCKYLFNLNASFCDGVTYITDHFAELSENMADLIHDLLKDNGRLSDFEALKLPQ